MSEATAVPEFSADELAQMRADTPASQHVLHFDNAGAALMPQPVSSYLHDYLHQEERLGGYRTQGLREQQLEHFYPAAAALLNCGVDEIAYAESATRAWQMAFYSMQFQAGDRILTSIVDYGSNIIAYLQQAKRLGVEVVILPLDEAGELDLAALRAAIDERVKLIAISHIPTGGGLINPAAAVGAIAREAGIPFLLDACQSIGQLPLDVAAIGCTMACSTGRKYLRGPRGTGLLYVRRDWVERLEPVIMDQMGAELLSASSYQPRADARRFEAWEQNCAGKGALALAMDYARHWGLARSAQRLQRLAASLRQQLRQIEGVEVMDQGRELCGIVTFRLSGCDPYAVKQALARQDVHISVSDGPGNLIWFQQRGVERLLRASVHYYNLESEVDDFVARITAIRQQTRRV